MWSSKELKVTVVKDEEELGELEHFTLWSMVQHWIHEQSNETSVSISLFNEKTCFRVDPSASYTVKSSRSESHTLDASTDPVTSRRRAAPFITNCLLYPMQNSTPTCSWCSWLDSCSSSLQMCSAGNGDREDVTDLHAAPSRYKCDRFVLGRTLFFLCSPNCPAPFF